MINLKNLNILLTGATGVIGNSILEKLNNFDAKIIATGTNSEKLNKISLEAKQVSKRGGELFCENTDDRVLIGGNAVLYMKGVIEID